MTGWVTPPPPSGGPGPVVGWVTPEEPAGLGVREAAREGWRLTRANLGSFAAITAVPVILLNLLTVPIWISAGQVFERMITFWTTVDWTRYRYDPEAFQREMQAAMQPSNEFVVIGTVGTGLAFIAWIIGVGAISAAALEAGDGRRPSFAGAFRAVGAHLQALVIPAIVLGVGYIVVFTPLSLSQSTLMYGGDAPIRAGLGLVLSVGALALEVVVLYLAIRWSLYFQVVIAEGLGFRAALSRSATLTSGARIRIGLIFIVWSIIVGLVVGIAGLLAALAAGVAFWSVGVGLAAFTITLSICGLVYLPFFVAVLTHIYRERVDAAGAGPATSG
jgi:Membrane domain of glycerophosphoryl diester phosphodiesterase